MSKELENLAQVDADTNGEEDLETMPMSGNPIEERPILEVASLEAPQPIQQEGGPTLAQSFFTKEEVSSVKDSVTYGMPNKRVMGEVARSSGQLVVPIVKPTKVYVVVQDAKEGKSGTCAL